MANRSKISLSIKTALLSAVLVFFASSARADDKEMFAHIYQTTFKNYIEPLSVEEIAVRSLRHMSELDPKYTLADDNRIITVYYDAEVAKVYRKPKDKNDIKAWTSLSFKLTREARKISSKIKDRDFEMVDVIMQKAFAEYDIGTGYYTEAPPQNDGYDRFFYSNDREDILYIRLKDFNTDVKEKIKNAIKPYHQAMILDLRGNQGGMLGEAVEVAKLFVDEGIVASSKARNEDVTKYYNAGDGDIFTERPMVVLVDGKTASSAEVVAAALKEQGRAVIVGTNTFGKGTIQTTYNLPNDSHLVLSTAYLYTPSNLKFDKIGLMPDICTSDKILVDDKSPCPREDRYKNTDDIDTAIDIIKNRHTKVRFH